MFAEDGPVFGPLDLDDELRARLAAGEGVAFRMGETLPGRRRAVYDTGRYLGARAGRLAPLLEHGFPWSGALWIEYAETTGWSRCRGLWLRPAWWRLVWRHRSYWPARRRYPADALLSSGFRG
ncbi:hypothetical protein [Prauserella muralis]|uniref:Uncharacterized protein n=1 Tax=Prauserella muralis TaxID=588067 RepID=A0A2V4ADG5_9PSEU|nr:hypothetical protein [Prauserella muralis]PXY16550.1 hypothetical protein BAY60_35710 [Prauserella muralis]